MKLLEITDANSHACNVIWSKACTILLFGRLQFIVTWQPYAKWHLNGYPTRSVIGRTDLLKKKWFLTTVYSRKRIFKYKWALYQHGILFRFCILPKAFIPVKINRRSQWPRGLRHEPSSPTRTLGSWVRIPLEAWMSVCVYFVFVLFCV
jgi:hypothetical protein